jgi:membrane fusion protein (multidrug efflux system)
MQSANAAAPAAPAREVPKPLVVLVAILVVTLGVIGTFKVVTRNQESTDDAVIEADVVPLSARLSGRISQVAVLDNQAVKKGDLIAVIEDSDFVARVHQAQAELDTASSQARAADAQVTVAEATAKGGLASAKAGVSGSSEQVSSAAAQISAAEAAVKRANSDATKAGQDLDRARELFSHNSVPQQLVDNANAANDTAKAAVEQAVAQLNAAREGKRVAESHVLEARGRLDQSTPIESQIEIARAQSAVAHARVEGAAAALELAKLQLSYTRLESLSDGFVSKLSVHPGQLVQPGQLVAALVPAVTYVVANFKETQIEHIRPGERAVVEVDAYPGRKIEAKVESVSGGTGSRFSLLPPDNASGNFVKVVQRVPVRIEWTEKPSIPMRAGLSAEVTIYAND